MIISSLNIIFKRFADKYKSLKNLLFSKYLNAILEVFIKLFELSKNSFKFKRLKKNK